MDSIVAKKKSIILIEREVERQRVAGGRGAGGARSLLGRLVSAVVPGRGQDPQQLIRSLQAEVRAGLGVGSSSSAALLGSGRTSRRCRSWHERRCRGQACSWWCEMYLCWLGPSDACWRPSSNAFREQASNLLRI